MALSKSEIDVEAGSDGEKVILCAACNNEGDHRPAVKYCIDCNQQLCKACVDSHRKIKQVKDHKLVDHANEDEVKLAQILSSYLVCPNHPEKNIEFMCKDHDVMCCITCATVNHRGCNQVVEVTIQATGANMSSKTQDVIEHLEAGKQQMEHLVTLHEKHNIDVLTQIETNIPKQVKEMKENIIKALDMLENMALNTSDAKGRKEIENGNAEISRWTSYIKNIEEASKLLKTIQQNGSDLHVFVAIKQTEKTLTELDKTISDQGTQLKLPYVTLEGDGHLQKIAKTASSDLVHVSEKIKICALPQYKYSKSTEPDVYGAPLKVTGTSKYDRKYRH